jgi:arylsulfatase A-like enzyme
MYRPSQMPLRPNVYQDGKLPAGDAAERWFRIYLWDFRFYMLGEPHTATLPDGFDLRHLVALYYGMTTWVDDLLGRLLLALDEEGMSRDTIVLFTSDHGDNLGSHHLFNKDRLIEESIRVPLVCRAPGRIPAGITSRRISSLVDIMPTALDLAGVEVPATVQGISRADAWCQDRTDSPPSGEAFIETTHDGIGIRTPGHTCGIRMDPQTRRLEPSAHLLYDVAHDPYQTHNLADRREHEAVRRDLEEQIREFHARTPWMQMASTDVGTVS